MELSAIKGIGPTRLESLRAVGVCSLRDLLYFLPQRYEDRTHPIPCADANGGEVLVMGVVQDAPKLSRFNGLTRVTAYLWDDSGKLPLVWYNQPWMMQNLPVGQTIMLFGRMGQSRGKPVLQNAQRGDGTVYPAGVPRREGDSGEVLPRNDAAGAGTGR